MRDWLHQAIHRIEADFQRSADTHLFRLDLPEFDGIDIYIKDESTHPTGSLKHRLARSLFLYALCNGKIRQGQPVIEASSGSTAVSEAYFARMLGLRFIAVMPRTTARSKIALIEFYGGECHFVGSAPEMHDAAVALAAKTGGYFMDQFMFAERATDWRGNNNIAESIYNQMRREPPPVPAAVVMSAGTGGTSATLGRYMRYCRHPTELVVVDPENSVFYDSYMTGDLTMTRACSSRIEGIGRPKVEPSFQHGVIDRMIQVPDGASVAAMQWLEARIGRKAGPSTGTNIWGTLQVAGEMRTAGRKGSIVTLLCDSGQRYLDTYYNPDWVAERIGEAGPWREKLDALCGPAA